MFDLDRQYNRCCNRRYNWPLYRRFILNMYISVYHTNQRPIKNMIGVVMNRLVGMGLTNISHIAPLRANGCVLGLFHSTETASYTLMVVGFRA